MANGQCNECHAEYADPHFLWHGQLAGHSTSLCMLSITNLTKPRQEAVFDCRGVAVHALPAVNQPNALCVHIMFTSHEKYLYCIVGAVHVRMASCTASSDWSVGWHYLIHLIK